MTIPIKISATTTGRKLMLSQLTIIGVKNAATTTITNDKNSMRPPKLNMT